MSTQTFKGGKGFARFAPETLFSNGLDGALLDVARHDGEWQPDWIFRDGVDGALLDISDHEGTP